MRKEHEINLHKYLEALWSPCACEGLLPVPAASCSDIAPICSQAAGGGSVQAPKRLSDGRQRPSNSRRALGPLVDASGYDGRQTHGSGLVAVGGLTLGGSLVPVSGCYGSQEVSGGSVVAVSNSMQVLDTAIAVADMQDGLVNGFAMLPSFFPEELSRLAFTRSVHKRWGTRKLSRLQLCTLGGVRRC